MERNWFADKMPGEVPFSEIEAKASEYHEWGFEPFTMQEMGYEGVLDKLKTYTAEKYEALDDAGKEKMVDEVLAIYRSVNLLPIQYYSELGVMNEIERCIAYKASFDGDTVSCVTGDTEFFNGYCWKPIKDYCKGDKVLQFVEGGSAELVDPIEYIHYESDAPFYLMDFDFPVKLTGNHDVVYLDRMTGGLRKSKFDEIRNGDIEEEFPILIPKFGVMDPIGDEELSDEEAKSIVYAVMNNTMIKSKYVIKMLGNPVTLSIDVYKLNKESIARLLSHFGIIYYEDDFEDDFEVREEVEDINFGSDETAGTVASLFNLFIGNGYLAPSGGWLKYSSDCFYRYTPDDYCVEDEYMERDKYCFTVPSHMLVLRREGVMFVTGNCGAGVGTTLCNYLFPNLFDVPSKHDLDKKDAETMFKKFHNDDYLRRAIKFCFSYKNGCPVPTNVTGGLRLVGSAPTNFRPMNAKAIYERFCPEGGTVYDFCCVDAETEFFNGEKWKRIDEYVKSDKVLQYNPDGSAELVVPEDYIYYESNDPFYLYQNDMMSSCLTGNHDVVTLIPGDADWNGVRKVKMKDIVEGKERGNNVPLTFIYGGSEDLNPDFMLLMFVLYALVHCNKGNEGAVSYKDGVFDIDFTEADFFWGNDYDDSLDDSFEECLGRLFILMYRASEDIVLSFKYSEADVLEVSCPLFKKYLSDEKGNLAFNGRAWNEISVKSKDDFWGIREDFSPSFADYMLSCALTPEDFDAKQFFINSIGYSSLFPDGEDEEFNSYYAGVSNYGSPSEFKEYHSKKKYCFTVPSHMLVLRRDKKIFVTGNCGFGGRMLGCLSSKKNFRYVGTDPCTETMYHLHQLGDYIEMVTGRDDSYELHCCGSEDFKGPAESVDFAFSSPPYFDLEVYSNEETQCFNKFPVLEDWLEGYVRATIRNIHYMLKKGSVYAVNIADFTVGGGKEVAYVDEWIRISTEEGMPLYDTVFLGVTARAGSKQQAAGELKKENILIFKKPL